MPNQSNRNLPMAVHVVCADGRSRHDEPFPDETTAHRWAQWGHPCTARHWIAYGPFDDADVSLIIGILERAGLGHAAARALTVTERDALLDVAAWSSIEDNHWSAALDRLAWLET